MEAILSLKSVREFSPQIVPESLIREILKDVMHVPVTGPQRPWQFVVINNRSILRQIPSFHSSAQLVSEAPLAVIICYDQHLGEEKEVWFRDCTAAAEALLLAGRARHLGGICLSIYPLPERVTGMQRLLGLPEHILPVSLIPLGYPRQQEQSAGRYDGRRVHYNHW